MLNVIPITDLSSSELDVYTRLSENDLLSKHEPEKGIFIAESPNVIERALNAGCIPLSILIETDELARTPYPLTLMDSDTQETSSASTSNVLHCNNYCANSGDNDCNQNNINVNTRIFTRPEIQNIPVYTAPMEVLSQITGFHLTRGMLCAMKRPALPSVEEICKNARRIVVLENVMNPTNVGAIFRSAAALNMDAILLTAGCSNPLYRRASRVSMGTVFQIPWTYICPDIPKKSPQNLVYKRSGTKPPTWEKDGINQLHELGFKTVAMALTDNSIAIDHPSLLKEEKLAIILGTEGDGLANSTIAACDYTVKIPMSHGVDSLNVAAASAVAFWELSK